MEYCGIIKDNVGYFLMIWIQLCCGKEENIFFCQIGGNYVRKIKKRFFEVVRKKDMEVFIVFKVWIFISKEGS